MPFALIPEGFKLQKVTKLQVKKKVAAISKSVADLTMDKLSHTDSLTPMSKMKLIELSNTIQAASRKLMK